MIRIYTQLKQGHQWLQQYQGRPPVFACILGFTAAGLIPGISAAGATPADRKYTAIADAEFLINGPTPHPRYPLPPLDIGASPVLISRAVIEACNLPVYLFNAGLPQPPAVPAIDLGGVPANCLTSGNALPLDTVKHLFEQGVKWGQKLAAIAADGYLIIGECVVGGTTTALSILTGLGIAAAGKVNSSHPTCNHAQKWEIVQVGLQRARLEHGYAIDPFQLVAAVGDPMQIAAAGLVMGASRSSGVLLAGGTQMLAVYALAEALAQPRVLGDRFKLKGIEPDSFLWQPTRVVVGTTRWVAEDSTGDTIGLAQAIGGVPLLATELSFATSQYPQLRAYEQGYVKEGVGAGGCAIACHLSKGWNSMELLQRIEALVERYNRC
ncbi:MULTISPECIES: nicotinate mononucleotide-dependent phosphoribosyltransferase CobT [unclassified Coleofasciculus]|uniref:nicotinate mononucleotide-dependent phosphoribosyltransferase CobT n=1 Tax=unclassified Coleofasciculus TaxID=2692782 RepID=UPI00187F4FA8|nr:MULTISPECIES: TIGR00303 family protein [unclassified Coleofasciculus]MBE9125924.1 TIGR00303 family protein [Coleofasciculus sp. LEGE 07081]MBE9149295.1 TIGR00303 family protein [Coleofasciculus sp. LEGE 07092]